MTSSKETRFADLTLADSVLSCERIGRIGAGDGLEGRIRKKHASTERVIKREEG
jgi:hypothetical protein